MSRNDESMRHKIQWYFDHPEYLKEFLNGIKDDELTRNRIRTIYVKMKYGQSSAQELAEYFDIPVKLVREIAEGKRFRKITEDLEEG